MNQDGSEDYVVDSVRVEGCPGEPVRVVCYIEGIYDVFSVRRQELS